MECERACCGARRAARAAPRARADGTPRPRGGRPPRPRSSIRHPMRLWGLCDGALLPRRPDLGGPPALARARLAPPPSAPPAWQHRPSASSARSAELPCRCIVAPRRRSFFSLQLDSVVGFARRVSGAVIRSKAITTVRAAVQEAGRAGRPPARPPRCARCPLHPIPRPSTPFPSSPAQPAPHAPRPLAAALHRDLHKGAGAPCAREMCGAKRTADTRDPNAARHAGTAARAGAK